MDTFVHRDALNSKMIKNDDGNSKFILKWQCLETISLLG